MSEIITLEFDADLIIKGMMENYPEASSPSLICQKFNYEKMQFQFYDVDEDKTYNIGITELRKGFKALLLSALTGKYNNYNFPKGVLSEEHIDIDATDCDALVQCAIFGEIIYG